MCSLVTPAGGRRPPAGRRRRGRRGCPACRGPRWDGRACPARGRGSGPHPPGRAARPGQTAELGCPALSWPVLGWLTPELPVLGCRALSCRPGRARAARPGLARQVPGCRGGCGRRRPPPRCPGRPQDVSQPREPRRGRAGPRRGRAGPGSGRGAVAAAVAGHGAGHGPGYLFLQRAAGRFAGHQVGHHVADLGQPAHRLGVPGHQQVQAALRAIVDGRRPRGRLVQHLLGLRLSGRYRVLRLLLGVTDGALRLVAG